MNGTGLIRAAFYCNPVLKVVIGCVTLILSGRKKAKKDGTINKLLNPGFVSS